MSEIKENNKSCSTSGKCPICEVAKGVWKLKKIYKFLLILVILIAGGFYYIMNTDWQSLVRNLVHKYGSEAVGTSVNIGKINLSLLNGKGSVSNITVANPKDYSSEYLMQIGSVAVNVDINSITKDVIIINEIRIDNPIITYELLNLNQSNVQTILDNIQKKSANQTKSAEAEKSADKNDASSKKVVIKRVFVADGEINIVNNLMGTSQTMNIPLPNVTVNNIGTEKQGVSIENGIARVFQAILGSATSAVSKVDLNKMLGSVGDMAKDTADKAGEVATDTVNGVSEGVKNVGAGVSDATKGIAEGVGGLFK